MLLQDNEMLLQDNIIRNDTCFPVYCVMLHMLPGLASAYFQASLELETPKIHQGEIFC